MKRIAIANESGYISQHFGHCPAYTIIDLEENEVKAQKVVDNPGHEPGVIPRFLAGHGVNTVVCGGIGQRAIGLFEGMDIEVIAGVAGSIDDIIQFIAAGTLEGGESLCSHGEDHGHDNCGHDDCGHH